LSQINYKPTSCQNCGHPSHCKQALWLENKSYQDGGDYSYKACDMCRCVVCQPPPKDIPTSMLNGL
jgi:hypothetical protein